MKWYYLTANGRIVFENDIPIQSPVRQVVEEYITRRAERDAYQYLGFGISLQEARERITESFTIVEVEP